MVETTILIANFHRNEQLSWNLRSLTRQKPEDTEILVLDDTFESDKECIKLVKEYEPVLNISYLHTGKQKHNDHWRVPGFAFNIGAKRTTGEYLFLCCAEIYHHNKTIEPMVKVLRAHEEKIMVIPIGKTDKNGAITSLLNKHGYLTDEEYENYGNRLLVKYPFFMGLYRKDFFAIGGYDEDFVGIGVEDKDLVERMKWRGGQYVQAPAKIIHLHHSRKHSGAPVNDGIENRLQHNRNIFHAKKGQIVRNQDKEWGAL